MVIVPFSATIVAAREGKAQSEVEQQFAQDLLDEVTPLMVTVIAEVQTHMFGEALQAGVDDGRDLGDSSTWEAVFGDTSSTGPGGQQ
jgi:hypothetical protein